jgi:hypothetical protein
MESKLPLGYTSHSNFPKRQVSRLKTRFFYHFLFDCLPMSKDASSPTGSTSSSSAAKPNKRWFIVVLIVILLGLGSVAADRATDGKFFRSVQDGVMTTIGGGMNTAQKTAVTGFEERLSALRSQRLRLSLAGGEVPAASEKSASEATETKSNDAPATPADAPATPADAPATPADAPATPADAPATPADAPATPADAPATPADAPATPADAPATPADSPATPADGSGAQPSADKPAAS